MRGLGVFAFRHSGGVAAPKKPTRLPMGFRWSPPIAQRTLLLILRAAGLEDCSICWIDNVLIVGSTQEEVERKLAKFREVAAQVNLEFVLDQSPSDSPAMQQVDFLGISIDFADGSFCFKEKFQGKVKEVLTEMTRRPSVDFPTLQVAAGLANWAMYGP